GGDQDLQGAETDEQHDGRGFRRQGPQVLASPQQAGTGEGDQRGDEVAPHYRWPVRAGEHVAPDGYHEGENADDQHRHLLLFDIEGAAQGLQKQQQAGDVGDVDGNVGGLRQAFLEQIQYEARGVADKACGPAGHAVFELLRVPEQDESCDCKNQQNRCCYAQEGEVQVKHSGGC